MQAVEGNQKKGGGVRAASRNPQPVALGSEVGQGPAAGTVEYAGAKKGNLGVRGVRGRGTRRGDMIARGSPL